jgi:hypothetical protein
MLLVGGTDQGGFHTLLPAGTPSPLADALVQQQSQQLTADVQLATLQPLFDTAEGLETPIQLIYLLALLGFLAAGAYLVVRQVLIRRELDEAAKSLGERIRTGEATCEVSIMATAMQHAQCRTSMCLRHSHSTAVVLQCFVECPKPDWSVHRLRGSCAISWLAGHAPEQLQGLMLVVVVEHSSDCVNRPAGGAALSC